MKEKKQKLIFIPIDNRPVCYTLAEQIAKIDKNLEIALPPRELLGGLYTQADVDGILNWLENVQGNLIVASLDTLAYGGLVASRRCPETFEQISERIEKLKQILKSKNAKTYAFSSIMRISNNNVNEEEKNYWSEWGTKIFEYSFNLDKNGEAKTEVPQEILDDYIQTRKRNFEINKLYLDWAKEGILDTLVFSKDDCAQFGMNVAEAKELEHLIKEKNIQALVKTGADEIPLTLMARAISNCEGKKLKISPMFLAPKYKDLISKYEDISIEKSVLAQLELAGVEICDKESADIELIVNNFEDHQGEIVMGIDTKPYLGDFETPQKPYIIADVRFANGADNAFVEKLLPQLDLDNFFGYSAWNTSANTLGSLIYACVVKFFSSDYDDAAFKELQLTRFLDDWAYQANVRQILRKEGKDPGLLKELMVPFETKIKEILKIDKDFEYLFPWDRLFEVEVKIK